MKRAAKILLIGLSVLIMFFFISEVLSYIVLGRLDFSYSCGSEFNKAFKVAVDNKDYSFCNNSNVQIKYAKDPFYARYFCRVPTLSNLGYNSIRMDSFRDSCLESMAGASDDIEACKLIKSEGSIISCVIGVVKKTGKKEYCDFIPEPDSGLKEKCLK